MASSKKYENREAFNFECTHCGEDVYQGSEPAFLVTVVDGEPAQYTACTPCAKLIKAYQEEYEKEIARAELTALGREIPEHLLPLEDIMAARKERLATAIASTKQPIKVMNAAEVVHLAPPPDPVLDAVLNALSKITERLDRLDPPKKAPSGRTKRKQV